MAGIFDRISGSEIPSFGALLPYEDILSALALAVLGIRTPGQIRDALNDKIAEDSGGGEPFLSADAEQDLMDMLSHIQARINAAGEVGGVAALSRIRFALSLWETKSFNTTEAECRQLSGVPFT